MAMAVAYAFTKEDMEVDQSTGYPTAYAKLCNDTSISPYIHGPPLSFTPYPLSSQEALRAKELDEMFPIIDPQANPTAKATIFVTLLWKKLNHLGNAGFDPAMFRVDPFGNVIYIHADSASPLAWNIDHWFPCSRGGLTVPSNLRILQWQVCKRKQNQLEFLVPWWDLQMGISINQFLSIFAASSSDFRQRSFRLLFSEGENEELNGVQTVDSHNFPQPFIESKDKLGLAPAAVVRTRRESFDASYSTLRSLDLNRQPRPTTPIIAAARKSKNGGLKESEVPDMVTNPYQAIVMARNSLKQREETNKMKAEIQTFDYEVNELSLKNEEEKITIQELELELITRRRRAEKCRKLAETQSSYRSMLEKMIRNAMHQSVVYREQVRQSQAATEALMARLEAQMAICKSAEKQLHKRFKVRDDLEEQARKRSKIDDTKRETNDTEERLDEPLKLTLGPEIIEETSIRFPIARVAEKEEDEESRQERGKGNVEKWLQMLLGDAELGGDDTSPPSSPTLPQQPARGNLGTSNTNEIIKMINDKYPLKEMKIHDDGEVIKIEPRQLRSMSTPRRSVSSEADLGKGNQLRRSFGGVRKEKGLARSESSRSLKLITIPPSPLMMLNMRKGVDLTRKKKPQDDEYGNENHAGYTNTNILRSSESCGLY